MSGINRRDTFKLAGAAAALGAGLGALFETRNADAAPVTPAGARANLKIDGAAQLKINTFKQLKVEPGMVQLKLYTASGQFLEASNVPEEIVKLFSEGTALQFKLYRPKMEGGELHAATEAFAATTIAQIKFGK